jgi:uncharacterized protein involved in exopolysaccharide biosynthesis
METSPPDAIELAEYHPWRRAVFFLAGFGICAAVAGFAWFYTRPPEYIAVSQLRIVPAGTSLDSGGGENPSNNLVSFLTEVQVLTSQAVLTEAITRLKTAGGLPDLGPNPVGAVQHLLRARPLEQTQVVELSAEGRESGFLAQLLNTVAESWRDRATRLYRQQISGEYQSLQKKADDLHVHTGEARARLDEFVEANGIPAAGAENALVADVQNLSASYTAALASFAQAQAHLTTLQSVTGTGSAANAGQTDPAVAALEQKAADLREQLTNLRRRFTPQFLALDSETRNLSNRVAELDGQIAAQRSAGRTAELRATQEQLQTSQWQIDRLSGDISAKQKELEEMAGRLAEYDALQDEVDRAEKLEQSMSDRVANLRASERERAPRLDVLQAAQFSAAPVHSVSAVYASIGLVGSLMVGVLAALFSKLLDGAPAVAWAPPTRRRYTDVIEARFVVRADYRIIDAEPRKLLPAPQRN